MKNAEASGDVKTFARNLARCVADSEPESYDLSMLAAQYANASAPLPRCLRNKAVPLQDGTWVALEAPYYAYVESYPRPDPPSAGFEGNTNSEESEKADALIIAGLALIVLFGLWRIGRVKGCCVFGATTRPMFAPRRRASSSVEESYEPLQSREQELPRRPGSPRGDGGEMKDVPLV